MSLDQALNAPKETEERTRETLRNKPRLPAVNIQCPICGDGEQCRGWKEIRETVARLRIHFKEKHMTPKGVIIPKFQEDKENLS